MGIVKSTKIKTADRDANRAREEGHLVYVHRFGMPNLTSASSCSVSGAAEVIESIEAAGWRLEHVTAEVDRAHGSLVMVFRPRDLVPPGSGASHITRFRLSLW